MKKLLLSLAAAAMTLSASAENFTFEIKDATDIQGTLVEQVDKPDGSGVQAYKHYAPLESLKLGAFSFSFAKSDEKNTDPAFYYSKTDECTVRLYAGGKMTISNPDVDLKTVTFNLTTLKGIDANNLPVSDNGSFSIGTDGNTLTWHAAETDVVKSTVVMTMPTEKGADGSNPQIRFASIVLSTEASEPDVPVTPGDHVYAGLLSTATTCDWTFSNVTLPAELEYIWSWKSYQSAYYLNASAYKDKTAYAAEAYAVSPVVDLTNLKSATATWEQACRFQTTIKDLCKFCVREEGAADWTELTIPEWPELNDKWTWASAGTVDLNAYAGKKVEFAFKYASSAEGADTWEIRNFFVDGEEKDGAVDGIEADSSVPARYFDLAGRSVAPDALANGIYVEVRGSKARKVVIRK